MDRDDEVNDGVHFKKKGMDVMERTFFRPCSHWNSYYCYYSTERREDVLHRWHFRSFLRGQVKSKLSDFGEEEECYMGGHHCFSGYR